MGGSTPVLRAVGAALALALIGCASESPPPKRSVLIGSDDRVLLILPLNVAAVMPPELEYVSPIVWKELELYLRAQGKQLKTVSRQAARKLWVKSIRQARAGAKGARAGFDDAASLLALELRKHTEFDALVAPSLFVREASIRNRTARWDGVERALEFETRGLAARSIAATPLEGVAPAASLHVAVFDAKGDKVHEGKGGLEVLVRVRVRVNSPAGDDDAVPVESDLGGSGAQRPLPPTFEFVTRTDLFADRDHLREGLAEAFLSFLPRMDY